MDLIIYSEITYNLFALFCSFFGLTNYMSTIGVKIKNLLNLYVIIMPASFRLLVDRLTHDTFYPLTL